MDIKQILKKDKEKNVTSNKSVVFQGNRQHQGYV